MSFVFPLLIIFMTFVGLVIKGNFEMANINMRNADYINFPSDLGENMVCPYLWVRARVEKIGLL